MLVHMCVCYMHYVCMCVHVCGLCTLVHVCVLFCVCMCVCMCVACVRECVRACVRVLGLTLPPHACEARALP